MSCTPFPTNLSGFVLPANSATATFVGGGAVAPDQRRDLDQGWWSIHKELQNINNDFRLSKQLSEDNTLTLGLYLAYYEMDDEWALGNQMLMTNEPNARPITVSYVDGGQTFQRTDEQGFRRRRRLQHHAEAATRSTARSICPTRGVSTSGCWTPRCATRIRRPPTASATCRMSISMAIR